VRGGSSGPVVCFKGTVDCAEAVVLPSLRPFASLFGSFGEEDEEAATTVAAILSLGLTGRGGALRGCCCC